DFTVFDEVSLRCRENKLAIGDVHLTAAEVYGKEPALYRLDDVVRIVLASQHVRVRHARHGDMFIALAPSVASIRDPHQARRELVADIALENSILDQCRVLRGRTFVIYIDRAALRWHRAMVNNCHLFARDSLAYESGESRSL